MEIKKVPDIKIRAKNEQGNLEWRSLRGQKMMAQGLWRTILPGTYRLSHEGYWYELNTLELEMYLAWSPYPTTGTPTDFQIIWRLPKEGRVPETVQAVLTKEDEARTTLHERTVEAGTAYSAIFRPITKYTSIPVRSTYTLRNGEALDSSNLARYSVNTNSIVLPNIQVGAEIVSFGPKSASNSVDILPYTGDLQYAEYSPPNIAQWDFSNSSGWLTLSKSGNSLIMSASDNTDGNNRETDIIVKHVQYPFITKSIHVTQSLNPGGDIPSDAEWLQIQFNWISTEGRDLDNKVQFIGFNDTEVKGDWLGFDKQITTPVDLYKKEYNQEVYTKIYSVGDKVRSSVNNYYWKNQEGQYIYIGDAGYCIPLLSDVPLLRWGGDRTSPGSTIKIPGETYLIDLKELKKNHRDQVTSDFSIKCESHWFGDSGAGRDIVFYVASFKGGFPKKVGYEWKVYTDEAYTTELQPVSYQDFPGISVNNSSNGYTYVADIKYVKGANWQDDTVKVVIR